MEPVGYLVDEADSIQIPITATTIIGSNPSQDPEAASGTAGMITIDDPDLAPVQVRIRIAGLEVTAEDVAGGGTWIQAPGETPTALTSDRRTLRDGDELRVGGCAYVYRRQPGQAGT